MRITKAIIPVAGFGTRLLPATKATPKELFPLLDAPVIHYVIKEAIDSGITDIALITSERKKEIERYFAADSELEKPLVAAGKAGLLERIEQLRDRANISYIVQPEQKGLGDAVSMGRDFVGDEPFAVLLGDAVTLSKTPVTRQLIDRAIQLGGEFAESEKGVDFMIGVEPIDRNRVNRYGIIDPGSRSDGGVRNSWFPINDLVEKPEVGHAPSNLAIAGRYLLPGSIFDSLEQTTRGNGGEIQLTDGIRSLLKGGARGFAYAFDGARYDIGNKLDFIRANLAFGLEDPEIREDLLADMALRAVIPAKSS